jgi:hypothetical protein
MSQEAYIPSSDPNKLSIGTLEKTNDGKTWVVDFYGARKRWIPYKSKSEKEKVYETHYNMSRPYIVRMTNKNAIIYENEINKRKKQAYVLPDYTKAFIGSGLYVFKKELQKKVLTDQESAVGNSLLFLYQHDPESKEYPYIFVGEKVITFILNEPVIKFNSPIVGADVSYPSAETKNNIYLLMPNENYIIPKSMIPKDVDHIYDWYYALPKDEKSKLQKFKIKIN